MAARRTWRQPSVLLLALVVVAAGATLVTLELTGRPAPAAAAKPSGSATLTQELSRIAPGVSSGVGSGGLATHPTPLTGAPPLVDSGSKPIVFFVSSEPCIACASERWALVVALSRFGTFSHLPLLPLAGSSGGTAYATFSFDGAAYSSPYLTFVSVEEFDASGHALQTLSTKGQQLVSAYDAPPYVPAADSGFIPWLDIANRYATQGSAFPPAVIANLDWVHVTAHFTHAADPVTRAIVGSANQLTAAICVATSMQPASVCAAAPIPALAAALR